MPNLTATAASNSFRVRDHAAMRAALEGLGVIVYTVEPEAASDPRDPNHVYLVAGNDGWPTERCHQDSLEVAELDMLSLIAPHLADGEVAVLKQAGAEGADSICGEARAVNHLGQTREVNIDAIYERARALGGNVARDV